MARLSTNPDQDFSVGYEKSAPELDDWREVPPLPLDDLFKDPVVRERIGKLIGSAMRRSGMPGW